MQISSYDQAKRLPNLLDYDKLIITILPFKEPKQLLTGNALTKFDGCYTLIPSSTPEVMLEDLFQVFTLKVIATNLDDGFSLVRYWDLFELELKSY